MKSKILLLAFLCFAEVQHNLHAQDLAGPYMVTGYFFHPIVPRSIALTKTLTKVGPKTYEVNILGDLTGWGFQFTVDASNHLTNWVATGNTYPPPASGFMTADNPGGFIFPGPPYPGTSPWVQSTYNNTYDPATNTFYLHYGYNASATNQNGYDRQIYEQYILLPRAQISSVTPLSGTSFTQLAINGKNLSLVDPAAFSISFGGVIADTGWVVSDSRIIARVAAGASGNVSISDINYSTDTFPGFVYTPVPPVINTGWSYLGKAGFSPNKAFYVSAASGTDNIPYVVFVDSASHRTKVMKFNGNNWSAVGSFVSDGGSSFTDIVVTKDNIPIVAFYDSTAGGITVKAYNSNQWTTLGIPGFTSAPSYSQSPFSLAADTNGIPYLSSFATGGIDSITVFRFQGKAWVTVGNPNFAASVYGSANIAIDKTTNAPYIVFDDMSQYNSIGYEASVMKFDGRQWVIVGNAGITHTRDGVFYPDLQIDNLGTPLIALQDDDGFERTSVYSFSTSWNFVGPQRFSKGRTYYSSVSVNQKNMPYVLYDDHSYNNQGTVMRYNKNKNKWDTVGARGFIPFSQSLQRHSLFFNVSGRPFVAFSDKNNGGKVSVVKYDNNTLLNEDRPTSNNAITNAVSEFDLYPNPAHNSITVNLSSKEINTQLQVYDINGKKVIEKTLSGSSMVNIDISKLIPGTYLLSIKTNTGFYSRKFIKN